jgi:hypothetical protein
MLGDPKARNFPLIENLDEKFGRATSLLGFQKIYHNAGHWFGWKFGSPSDLSDESFKSTVAHEFGHLILNEYGAGSDYSWTHKGTSTEYTQKRLPGNPIPAIGEIDLMHYHSDDPTNEVQWRGFYARSIAAEQDAKSLLWLSRVKFGN